MRILFDTNIILDVLQAREPHARAATALLDAVARKELTGLLGATSVTTLFYLMSKAAGAATARKHVATLMTLFDIAPVTRPVLAGALKIGFKDYEDAVLHQAALEAGATGIVTRDPAGFAAATLSIYAPVELLKLINVTRER